MRGKKKNPEFISKYIADCLQSGITDSEDILQIAKDHVKKIDDQIREVEDLKVLRSKILDVISTFDKSVPKVEGAQVLSLFNLEYPDICKLLCEMVSTKNQVFLHILNMDPDWKFCLKQLLEHKILIRSDDCISRGERFSEYMKMILHQE